MPDQKQGKPGEGVVDEKRRALLGKAAYTAPAIVTLGLAARSGQAQTLPSNPPPPTFNSEDDQLLEDAQELEGQNGD